MNIKNLDKNTLRIEYPNTRFARDFRADLEKRNNKVFIEVAWTDLRPSIPQQQGDLYVHKASEVIDFLKDLGKLDDNSLDKIAEFLDI